MQDLIREIHDNAVDKGFWDDYKFLDKIHLDDDRRESLKTAIILAKIALSHSELSEGLEGVRRGNILFTKPKDGSLEEELADTIIRIFDICEAVGIKDIINTITVKHNHNKGRPFKHDKVI